MHRREQTSLLYFNQMVAWNNAIEHFLLYVSCNIHTNARTHTHSQIQNPKDTNGCGYMDAHVIFAQFQVHDASPSAYVNVYECVK